MRKENIKYHELSASPERWLEMQDFRSSAELPSQFIVTNPTLQFKCPALGSGFAPFLKSFPSSPL
jgi:hypothetical protein